MADTKAEQLTQVILNVFRLNGALTEWGDRFVLPEGLTSTRWRMLGAVALAQTANNRASDRINDGCYTAGRTETTESAGGIKPDGNTA